MTVTDNSKATKFIVWCDTCRIDMKFVVKSQRTKPPVACPFCKGDILIESIKTFPRGNRG